MTGKSCRVCVTGGAGFIGSWLVEKLLRKGYVVHTTLRNLGDESKTGLLKSFAGADSRLFLFEADIYEQASFEAAIQGCEFVFLVATPLQHYSHSSKYQSTTEAAVAAVRRILKVCELSGSVRRVIYTGSVTASSPLKEDGTGLNHTLDESCWTPINLSFCHCSDNEKAYTSSKTLAEKEILSYNNLKEKEGMEVVSLACGLVGGETLLPYMPASVRVVVAPVIGEEQSYQQLEFLQGLLGSVPLVHIDDVCEAHIFCMEKPSMAGRFICANGYPLIYDFAQYFACKHPQMEVIKGLEDKEPRRIIKYTSRKLEDFGFKYIHGVGQILDDSIKCMKRLGIN